MKDSLLATLPDLRPARSLLTDVSPQNDSFRPLYSWLPRSGNPKVNRL